MEQAAIKRIETLNTAKRLRKIQPLGVCFSFFSTMFSRNALRSRPPQFRLPSRLFFNIQKMGSSTSKSQEPQITLYSSDSTGFWSYDVTNPEILKKGISPTVNHWAKKVTLTESSSDDEESEGGSATIDESDSSKDQTELQDQCTDSKILDKTESKDPSPYSGKKTKKRKQLHINPIEAKLQAHKIDGIWLRNFKNPHLIDFLQNSDPLPFSLRYLQLDLMETGGEGLKELTINLPNTDLVTLKLYKCAPLLDQSPFISWLESASKLQSLTFSIHPFEKGFYHHGFEWKDTKNRERMGMLLTKIKEVQLSPEIVNFFYGTSWWEKLLPRACDLDGINTSIFPTSVLNDGAKEEDIKIVLELLKRQKFIDLDLEHFKVDLHLYQRIIESKTDDFKHVKIRMHSVPKNAPLLKNVKSLHFWRLNGDMLEWLCSSIKDENWNIQSISHGYEGPNETDLACLKEAAEQSKSTKIRETNVPNTWKWWV